MWDDPVTYLVMGIGLIAAVLTRGYWGDWVYITGRIIGHNWKGLSFITAFLLVGVFAVSMQQDLKYKLAYSYFADKAPQDTGETAYQIRQCKEFVRAKASGEETAEYRQISAGPVNITKISYFDVCARTFGLNFWRYDISIDGQDGGRLLCETYARSTYRSSKVQSWCDTVFSPRTEMTSISTNAGEPSGDRGA